MSSGAIAGKEAETALKSLSLSGIGNSAGIAGAGLRGLLLGILGLAVTEI